MKKCKYCEKNYVAKVDNPCNTCQSKLDIFRKIKRMGTQYKKRYNKT